MAVSSEEKRRFLRIGVRVPIRYQVRGIPEFNNTVSENLSSNGLGFKSHEFITPGTAVMLEINLLSRCLRPIGKISWSAPLPHSDRYRSGVEFLELEHREEEYLTDYIDLQTGKL